MSATPDQLRAELLRVIWQQGPVSAEPLMDLTYQAGFTLVDAVNHLAALSQAELIVADEGDRVFLPGMDEDAARREYGRLAGGPTCRVCGCSDNWACEGGCFWAEDDLCSRCADPAGAPA